jgi:flagellar biosynthesis protein FlhF
MKLKTYIVNDMSEAMTQIKKDLGKNAIILNTKKIKTGGFLGLFQKQQIKVIAATDERPEQEKQAESGREVLKETIQPEVQFVSRKEEIEPKVEGKRDQQEKQTVHSSDNNQVASELLSEIKYIKNFMLQVLDEDRLPHALQKVNQRLKNQGVNNDIRLEIVEKLMLEIGKQPDYLDHEVSDWAKREIITKLKPLTNQLQPYYSKIMCFIGPTGVGKTTTIAKIGANLILNENKKIGLITSDTYRIAAVEQLRTYADILGIQLEVVQSAEELKEAVEKLDDCDCILMDTAGRNYQQQQYIEEMETLLRAENVEVNLVLSLTTKYNDIKKIIDNFTLIQIDGLLLTKLDETRSYGAILNVLTEYSLPLRYITNGQSVPNDIFIAAPERIANFILGEDGHD